MSTVMIRCGIFVFVLALTACATEPRKDLTFERANTRLQELDRDQKLKGLAERETADARAAVRALLDTKGNKLARAHLAYVAERRIDIARAQAQREWADNQTREYQALHAKLLLEMRTLEARIARQEAAAARLESAARAEEVERTNARALAAAKREQESLRRANMAEREAAQARRVADAQAKEASLARQEAEMIRATLGDLQAQLNALKSKSVRGDIVVTLGDVLFQTNEADLRPNAIQELASIVAFLGEYPDRKIRVEGHTDNRGTEALNQQLSEWRAESVRFALMDAGIDAKRVTYVGFGESRPVENNDTADGRGKNRRVDIVILEN